MNFYKVASGDRIDDKSLQKSIGEITARVDRVSDLGVGRALELRAQRLYERTSEICEHEPRKSTASKDVILRFQILQGQSLCSEKRFNGDNICGAAVQLDRTVRSIDASLKRCSKRSGTNYREGDDRKESPPIA